MKKLIFNFAIILSFTALCLTSCKDEDDDAPISGTGGELTGVWRQIQGNTLSNNGIRINSNGRVEKVTISGTAATALHDYAEGIITSVSGNSFQIVGLDGQKSGSFQKETSVEVRDDHFVAESRVRFSFGIREVSAGDGFSLSGSYVKVGGSSGDQLEKDSQLMGRWEKEFGLNAFIVDNSYIADDGSQFTDWYTKDGTLYLYSADSGILTYSYRVDNDQLTIKKGYSEQTYARAGSYTLPKDAQLKGNWVQPFGTDYLYISEESVTHNTDSYKNWYTEGNTLYLLTFGNQKETHTYSIDNDKLSIRIDGVQKTFYREGSSAIPTGDCGELGGVWAKADNNYQILADGYGMYGISIAYNGNVTTTRVSTTDMSLTLSQNASMIITEAANGSFRGIGLDGNVNGTYTLDTMILFMNNIPTLRIDLNIKTTNYNFSIDGQPWKGRYAKVKEASGAIFNALNCKDNALTGTKWGNRYFDEEYNDYVTEYFVFSDNVMQYYQADDHGNQTVPSDYIWATIFKGGSQWLVFKSENGEPFSYEYYTWEGEFFFKTDAGSWVKFKRED